MVTAAMGGIGYRATVVAVGIVATLQSILAAGLGMTGTATSMGRGAAVGAGIGANSSSKVEA